MGCHPEQLCLSSRRGLRLYRVRILVIIIINHHHTVKSLKTQTINSKITVVKRNNGTTVGFIFSVTWRFLQFDVSKTAAGNCTGVAYTTVIVDIDCWLQRTVGAQCVFCLHHCRMTRNRYIDDRRCCIVSDVTEWCALCSQLLYSRLMLCCWNIHAAELTCRVLTTCRPPYRHRALATMSTDLRGSSFDK